jgi:hypothetical protein
MTSMPEDRARASARSVSRFIDDPTHVPTWDQLTALLGRSDFLYVADSKLASAAAIEALATRLAGPKCRPKTTVAVEQEATAALAKAGASRWVTFTVDETTEETFRQERRGQPGANTRYRRHTRTRHTVTADIRLDLVAYDAVTDGCFPLVTNDTALTDAGVLAAYRYQPNLERRHHLLKAVQDAAPLLLRSPPGSRRCSAASSSPWSSPR